MDIFEVAKLLMHPKTFSEGCNPVKDYVYHNFIILAERKITEKKIKKGIYKYYKDTTEPEKIEIINNISKVKDIYFPYPWCNNLIKSKKKYMNDFIVNYDPDKDLKYSQIYNKKIYFPLTYSKKQIQSYLFQLQIVEQNDESPHKYLTDSFNVNEEDIVVDCGVAEGNFSLSVVETVKRLYLFEPEEIWMKPLKATFEPWKDKIVIVQKYVSNVTDEKSITIDDYFENIEEPTFIKIDIEGYEKYCIEGAKKILSSKKLQKIVCCTYHKQDDEEVIGNILKSYNFTISASKGYMIFKCDPSLKEPFLRRGVIRCKK